MQNKKLKKKLKKTRKRVDIFYKFVKLDVESYPDIGLGSKILRRWQNGQEESSKKNSKEESSKEEKEIRVLRR